MFTSKEQRRGGAAPWWCSAATPLSPVSPPDVTMEAAPPDPLRAERLPSSPGPPSSDSSVEYGRWLAEPSSLGCVSLRFNAVPLLLPDDLPDLQEVPEEAQPAVPPVYQVDVDVSHREPNTQPPPDTHRLTQLAHIATGPQSPLLRGSAVSRSVRLLLKLGDAEASALAS